MPLRNTALRIDLGRARAHWHARQGLAQPVKGTVDEVVAATGWPRTLGGVDVYLSVRARLPGMRRRDLDAAVAASKLQVIPAVRGCIYLVPRASVPLLLRVAEEQSRGRTERDLEKAGVTHKELSDVAEAALLTLRKGPLSPDALRKAMQAGIVRSLGEKGKKIGMSSPLPSALRHLEFEGKIERSPEGSRLDTERYEWRLTKKSPFAGAKIPSDPTERNAAVAREFFHKAGPVTLKDFAAWAGFSQRDARAAMDKTPLVPVAVDGYADETFALEDDLAVLREAAEPCQTLSLLSFEDNFSTLHGGVGLLADPKHHGKRIPVWGQSKEVALGEAKHMTMRPLFDGEQLAGFWEYDPDTAEIVVGSLDPLPRRKKQAALALAQDTAKFLRDELGHAKSFLLDTPQALRERAGLVRAM